MLGHALTSLDKFDCATCWCRVEEFSRRKIVHPRRITDSEVLGIIGLVKGNVLIAKVSLDELSLSNEEELKIG